jgi:putative DNA primase/helicase
MPEGKGEGLTLLIAEGVATTLSVQEATGYPAVAALSLSNFAKTLKVMRARYPKATLLLLADLDKKTGKAAPDASKAAKASGAILIAPDFGPDRPEGATDFNDLHQAQGLDAVRGQIERVAEIVRPGVEAEASVAPEGDVETTDGVEPNPFPAIEDRPRYLVIDDWVKFKLEGRIKKARPGVYHCGIDTKGDEPKPFETWFCSPLHVDAITFDAQHNNFGRLLRFKNTLGKWREWAMPMDLLKGSGEELRGELLNMGVDLHAYHARREMPSYLTQERPERRMHCALQTGWAGSNFVLPDVVIGPTAAGVIFQTGERQLDEYTTAGTLDGWKAGIGALAVGNPILMMNLSAGFTGPMLAKCNAEGGGIHNYGDSSTGKTTLIEGACSIWGGTNYRRSWKGTANGQEAVAALFNDNLLALDEISEADPREVGSVIYQLGNGRGKQRANRSGAARSVARWRCLILSSGERTIATTMLEGGHRAKAGQSVRMLDIPVARKYGAWDDLHGMASGAAFSDAIKRASAAQHGHVGRSFLERLTRETQDFSATLEGVKALPLFGVSGGEGQDKRAAARFALIGMSGELATEYGLTGWTAGDALKAAALCLRLWQAERGTGNNEQREILEKISRFIERHGDSRFSDADSTADAKVYDRAGWWRDGPGGRHYLFNADGMREALAGFDFKRALDVLQMLGAIDPPKANGERARFERIDGRAVKVYRVDPDKLTDCEVAGGEHGA